MSTQDRLGREGSGAHADQQHDSSADEAGGGASENLRMRAMHRRWVQRKASHTGHESGQAAIPEAGGSPLGKDVRGKMERTLGADLSGVRVHTGGESAQAADGMGARAFTVGSDVHFNRGEFSPGSKEGDRLLAHELTHVVQGQKSGVQRKANAEGDAVDGDHEAGGHEVSEPGDASEQEADAAGDHAADALHGDKKKGKGQGKDKEKGKEKDRADAKDDGEHGDKSTGGAEGEAKEGGDSDAEGAEKGDKPQISAGAAGVSRKIFRAPKPGAPAATPRPGAAAAPRPGAAPAPGANALSPQDTQKLTRIKTQLESAPVSPMLQSMLKSAEPDLQRLITGPQGQDPAVLAVKMLYDQKKANVEEAFDVAVNGAAQAILQINTQLPGAYAQFQAAWRNPDVDKWAGLAMVSYKDRPAALALKQAKETQERVIKDKHRETMGKAVADMRQVAAEPDPSKPEDNPLAKADAVFDGVRTWMNVIGGPTTWEQQIQDAYMAKREQINAATAAREAKKQQEQAAAAEKQKQQQQQQQAQAAAGGSGAGAAQGATSAPTAGASAAPTAAAPPAQQAPASAAGPKPTPTATPPSPTQAPPGQAAAANAGGAAPKSQAPPTQQSAPPAQPAAAEASPAGQQQQQPSPAAASAAPPAAAQPGVQPAAGEHGPPPQAAGAAAPEAGHAHGLTPEQENKLQQLEMMLEIASAEAADSTNGFSLGATIVTNLATVVNPGFLGLALLKSGAVLTAKFKHEFDTKVATRMLKQLPADQIDVMLVDWTAQLPSFEAVMADVKIAHNKALSAKQKVGAGLSGAGQLGKDDWKELLVEGGEITEHVAKEMLEHLPHALEHLGHALPFVGIAASVWGVIANIRKIKTLRHELQELQELKFGAGGAQPAPAAPGAAPPPSHH
ncbi:MAG: hypothetical protein JWN44_6897 [Myxococcales bacterium]|nr:hypothetical protein [Myxococcales bacterium]